MYNSSYNFQQLPQADALNLQSKYFLMMVDNKQAPAIAENNLLESQLNDTDAELLNLLAVEGDCTEILQNIANNEQFEQLINNGAADFAAADNLAREFMGQESYDGICGTMQEVEVHATGDDVHLGDIVLDKSSNTSIVPEGKPLRFACAHCDKVCTTKKLLKYHIMTHTGSRPYSCDICDKTFKHNYQVKTHQRCHNRPTFQCDICSKMFIHKSHLTAHRRKHLGDFVAYCKDCNKGFISQGAYRNHVKIQHEKVLHVCDVCGAQLSTMSALKEHKSTHEPDYKTQRTHVCEVCGRSYLTARNLRSHMNSHTQLHNYICNICGKSLSGKKVLETHVKIHTGEKDFACKYCSKCFSSKKYVTIHERTHTGDKPFKCQVCHKLFTQRTSLTVHLRYHSGERPYKCQCGKGFVTKTHLIGHYKTHEIGNIEFSYIPQTL